MDKSVGCCWDAFVEKEFLRGAAYCFLREGGVLQILLGVHDLQMCCVTRARGLNAEVCWSVFR